MADDPKIPEFETPRSLSRFSRSVRSESRYALNAEDRAFLETVSATIHSMDRTLNTGMRLFRAQLGWDWQEVPLLETDDNGDVIFEDTDTMCTGHPKSRMIPTAKYATSGRANAQGIPVLYLANRIETAISEIRPWIGSNVSVAEFHTKRELKALDLTKAKFREPRVNIFRNLTDNPAPPTREEKENEVWSAINDAFSIPVSDQDRLASSYVPTQILAELFKSEGYDALIYKSNFGGPAGRNVVLFNLDSADCVRCTPFNIKSVKLNYELAGNGW